MGSLVPAAGSADTGDMIYAGIDEAGYGPILGPLCVASSVFRIPEGMSEQSPPDLWEALSSVVCRSRAEAGTSRLAVADSKRLKLANTVKRQHPLHHLELGVLAFLESQPGALKIGSVEQLLARLAADPGHLPWYGADGDPSLPISTTPDHLHLLSARLKQACALTGIEPMDLRCLSVCEHRFNEELVRLPGKAAVSFHRVASLISRVWRSESAMQDNPACCPRIVVDRQGGRARYAGTLAHAFPDAAVVTVGESAQRSVYELVGNGRRVRVSFEVEAEARHLPVALASMTAKLVRELLVARLNRYWQSRCVELKPTAGYAQDGGRYLRDLAGVASASELAALRRHA